MSIQVIRNDSGIYIEVNGKPFGPYSDKQLDKILKDLQAMKG